MCFSAHEPKSESLESKRIKENKKHTLKGRCSVEHRMSKKCRHARKEIPKAVREISHCSLKEKQNTEM